MKLNIIILSFCLFCVTQVAFLQTNAKLLVSTKGEISFTSNAPLEVIKATSKKLKGIIDAEKQTFAFTVPIISFEGFNSALQREHFNENYMESNKFAEGSFSGTLVDKVDFSQNGTQQVRVKGKLKIHGVEQERIIKSTIKVENGIISISSKFVVPLAEHKITIPKIVNQKIATEIEVEIKAQLSNSTK